MNERAESRTHLIYYLRLFNAQTDLEIGQVVDIASQGVKVIASEPIEENQSFDVRMQLPDEHAGRRETAFRVKCVWCRVDEHPEFYQVGFEISEMGGPTREAIDWLIETFEFSGRIETGYDIDLNQ